MKKVKFGDDEKNINSVSFMLGKLVTEIENLQTHFTNHLHTHKWDKILGGIYFLCLLLMFAYLKWGS